MMTNDEKALLRLYAREGWTLEEIRPEIYCTDRTIRKYIEVFGPKNTDVSTHLAAGQQGEGEGEGEGE